MKSPHAIEGMRSGLWLPPKDVRLIDTDIDGKLETPLDARGLVDLDKLVTLGKQAVSSNYDWTSPFNDVHHLHWPGAFYMQDADETDHAFRELAQRKAYVPRRFHNWVHLITEPPPVPDTETMLLAIKAQSTAKAIAVTAQLAVRLTRMKGIPEAKLVQRLGQEFDNYTVYVENAREVPIEFQLLKLDEVEARDIDEMLLANKRLGKMAIDHIPVRFRQLHSAAA
jgi:hypothetical protein